MPKKLTEQEKVLRIFKELPFETKTEILDVSCRNLDTVTLKDIEIDIKCSIDKLKMDAEEFDEYDYKEQLKQAEKVYKKYSKWFTIKKR